MSGRYVQLEEPRRRLQRTDSIFGAVLTFEHKSRIKIDDNSTISTAFGAQTSIPHTDCVSDLTEESDATKYQLLVGSTYLALILTLSGAVYT
jgi:hypothetical protein